MSDRYPTIQRFEIYLERYGNLRFDDFKQRVWVPPTGVSLDIEPIENATIHRYFVCNARLRYNHFANRYEILVADHLEWAHNSNMINFNVHEAIRNTLEDKYDAKIKYITLLPNEAQQ